VAKVYILMLMQTWVTLIWVIVVKNNKGIQEWIIDNIWLFYLSLVASIGIMISIFCFSKVARKHPLNLILLAAYTIFESYMVGAICIFYSVDSILMAMSCTVALFVGLSIFAVCTKKDLTYMGGMLAGGSMILLIAIIMTFFIKIKILQTIIIVLILLLACVYVIYDTQLIIGKGKHALSMDDYVTGALMLYSDLITIFTALLQLMGR
jgi:FtsH-binding integral membrane protein